MSDRQRTAFGEWVKTQPRGVLTQVMRTTGLAWATVHGAQYRFVSRDVAVLLARCTAKAVKPSQLIKKRPAHATRVVSAA
jgi:hypothetical protein